MSRAALAAAVGFAFVVACALVDRVVHADPVADAERTFHAALGSGDIGALEALGASRPLTRWSDDAWSEAAHLAERQGDLVRAQRDVQQLLAIEPELVVAGTGDELLARRARLDLARYEGVVGTRDEWAEVAAAHERLSSRLHAGGDPKPALRELETLVRDHPRYPRGVAVMLALAGGWEREGEPARAVKWLDDADRAATNDADRLHARAELVRTLIRAGDLDTAEARLAALSSRSREAAPAGLVASLRAMLDGARFRRHVRWLAWLVLGAIAAAAIVALRRAAPSWRAAARRLARPPAEAIFLVPLATILVVVAYTGNPLVARAVRTIALSGVAASWLSGAILHGRTIGLSRALVHAACAVLAVAAATYLAVDDGHLINFVIETWREGPAG